MKRIVPQGSVAPMQCVVDPKLKGAHPRLHAFLADSFWEDGDKHTPRERGSVIVWADNGQWKAKLLDRDGPSSVLVAAPSWSTLWDACEAVLGDPGAGWKLDAPGGKSSKKKGG